MGEGGGEKQSGRPVLRLPLATCRNVSIVSGTVCVSLCCVLCLFSARQLIHVMCRSFLLHWMSVLYYCIPCRSGVDSGA